MYQFLSGLWDKIAGFFISIVDFLIAIPGKVIEFIADVYQWCLKEVFSLSVNFLMDTISAIGTTFNPDFDLNRELLLSALAKINVFFPVDTACTYTIFLLNTWVAVHLYKLLATWGLAFLFPKRIFKLKTN